MFESPYPYPLVILCILAYFFYGCTHIILAQKEEKDLKPALGEMGHLGKEITEVV